MNRTFAGVLLAAGLVFLGAPIRADDEAKEACSLIDCIKQSEVRLGLRYRFELVDDEAFERDAEASTLRTSLSLKTASWRSFSAFLEAENVTVVGDSDSFRNAGAGSLSNGASDRPVVADVAQTELNQAYLQYDLEDVAFRLGRREINHADQRFVGAVGWRQNHQSFDAFTIEGKPSQKITWTYAYLDTAHRIFGDSRDMNTHLLAGSYDFGRAVLRAYGLELDFQSPGAAGASSRTLGAEVTGGWNASATVRVLYELELADQTDAGDNPNEVDAGYLHLMLGGKFDAFTARVGLEVLEGSPEDGRFLTPLATLHKFNGWADKFLNTPATGLEDTYLSLGYKRDAWNLAAIYHRFESDTGSIDYGSEVDLLISWTAPWKQQIALKVADYQADGFSTDTTKWMLWSAYTF